MSPSEAEQTRRALLDSGRRLFAESGFTATSLNAVAAEAGVTRGAIHHHFGNKADLFTAVFIALEEELDAAVRAAASGQATAHSAFMAACTAWLDFSVRPYYRQIALTDAPGVLGAETWHRIDAGIGLASMQLGLTALHAEQPFVIEPSPALAVLLFGALTEAGISLSHDDGPNRSELLDAWERVITRLAKDA